MLPESFAVGDRVYVNTEGGKQGEVLMDNGGGTFLIALDEKRDGERRRIGANGRDLSLVNPKPKPPVKGMTTKAAPSGLSAVVDPDEPATDEDEPATDEDEPATDEDEPDPPQSKPGRGKR